MVKNYIYIIIVIFFISCITTESSVENEVELASIEPIDFPKSICFPLDYSVFNISNDEDIKLLVNEQPNFLKNHFDTSLEKLFRNNKIKVVEEGCIHNLSVKELTLKEFKIQVNGPEVNVATVRVDYVFKSSTIDTVLFESIDRESIPEFEKEIFEEMCEELSLKLVERITPFIEE